MEVAASRPTRLLPLRIVAALLLLAQALALTKSVVLRHELLAEHPALSQKMLAVTIAITFLGAVALVFLAFLRQRFGLWIVLFCAAAEMGLETWAGYAPLYVLRLPVAAALVFLTAARAWPELHGVAGRPAGRVS
jgi:hypothetical protein